MVGISLGRRRGSIVAVVLLSVSLLSTVGQGTAHADVTSVSGSAFGYYLSVAFDFGGGPGPPQVTDRTPLVTLPPTGGSETTTVPSGTAAAGPARFFESGPITVSTSGATGPTGSSTSSVSIIQDKDGEDPFYFSTLDSTCTASEAGTTGSATLTGGSLNQGGGAGVTLPDRPAPNTEYFGTIDGVNDNFRIVLNEQVLTSDSITVNAVHMYLLGPTANGELIVGQSHCDVVATSANQAPVANDDAYSTDSFRLDVPAPGVLSNDTDSDGDPLSAQVQTQPTNGTVTVNPDGSFTYRPNAGFSGTDTFTYLLRDPRGANDTATVTIDVTPPPPPVLDNDNFADAKVITGVSGGVTGTTVGATSEPGETSHGNSGLSSSVWYQWTAPEDLKVTFDTCTSDAPSVFDVVMGDSIDVLTPVASSFDGYSDPDDPNQCRATFQGNRGTVYRIAVSPLYFEGPLVLKWTSVPSPGPANDNFADAQTISGSSGSVTGSNVNATEEAGEPNHAVNNIPGAVSIWYDWTAPADGEVTFNTCQSRSETPTINGGWLDTILAVYTGDSVSTLTEVTSNDEDFDELCGGGRVQDRPGGSRVTFVATAGTVYHIAVDGAPVYPDIVGQVGTVVLEWKMATGNEPVAVDDYLVVANNTGSVNVLANDHDPNGDTITLTSNTTPYSGTVSCSPAGTCTYTTSPAQVGQRFTDSFKYTVTDSGGEYSTATVTVAVNLPVGTDDTYSTTVDTPLTVEAPGVLSNDTDPLGEPLTANNPSDPAGGSVTLNPDGSFIYTPDAGFTGTDTFTYTALSPTGYPSIPPATVTITVTAPNRPPVAGDDTYTTPAGRALTVNAPGVLRNDTDPDGDNLTAGSVSDPAGGSVVLNANGSFTYTPDIGFAGTDTFTYTASDGNGGTATATVRVTVAAPTGPTCGGRRATIVGTTGADRLFGTAAGEVIVGLGGDDSIYSYGGNDVICGGAGNDIIYGGAGTDTINGEGGNDRVIGDSGNDVLRGGDGSDRVFGGDGNDQVIGNANVDYCYGGTGTNTFATCEVFPAGT